MFKYRSLEAVGVWLAETKRSERTAFPDLSARLDVAQGRLSLAARIWPTHEPSPVLATPNDDPKDVRQIMAFWVQYGAVAEQVIAGVTQYRLATHRDRAVRVKCVKCGHISQAKWIESLSNKDCVRCRTNAPVVLVARGV